MGVNDAMRGKEGWERTGEDGGLREAISSCRIPGARIGESCGESCGDNEGPRSLTNPFASILERNSSDPLPLLISLLAEKISASSSITREDRLGESIGEKEDGERGACNGDASP
tara:strand:- start:127 stop:468 length:342 start_codon:yes stop_codon:yes gene_type:complete